MMNLDELKRRFERTSKVFSIQEVESLAEEVCNGNIEIDFGDRFHGTFFYEVLPLAMIGRYLGVELEGLQFVGHHERFDGRLFLSGGNEVLVEMTAAIDGHNDALQMELLAERGHAPAFQKIKATGTSRNRIFEKNETIAFASTDYDERVLAPLLEQALRKKVSKAKTNQKYSGAWLGVVFDDYVQPIVEKKKSRFDPICEAVLSNWSRSKLPFARIFFVGVSGEYIFDGSR